ncbi:homeobox protein 9-like [Mytilus trossulus]|uniref:homeobox protein 9-like n=1 Tax=Mytilus trossulus TaxID=6551 RepID=UPI003006154E
MPRTNRNDNSNSNKRKDRNSSDSGTDTKQNKQSKQYKRSEFQESDISVSEILNHTNSILYNSDDDIESKVFSETPVEQNQTKNNTETKMASSGKNQNKNTDPSVSEKLDTIVSAIHDLKSNQEGMKRMFESKLDKLRTDLMANVDNKIRALRDELSVDISMETRRTDQLSVQSIQSRLDGIEEHNITHSADNGNGVLNSVDNLHINPLNNPEITITASGIPVTEGQSGESY